MLGAETLRGLYPVETISTVGRICGEVRDAGPNCRLRPLVPQGCLVFVESGGLESSDTATSPGRSGTLLAAISCACQSLEVPCSDWEGVPTSLVLCSG